MALANLTDGTRHGAVTRPSPSVGASAVSGALHSAVPHSTTDLTHGALVAHRPAAQPAAAPTTNASKAHRPAAKPAAAPAGGHRAKRPPAKPPAGSTAAQITAHHQAYLKYLAGKAAKAKAITAHHKKYLAYLAKPHKKRPAAKPPAGTKHPKAKKVAKATPTNSPAPLVDAGGGGSLFGDLFPLILIAGAGLALWYLYTHRNKRGH